jgi:hypothetical protein
MLEEKSKKAKKPLHSRPLDPIDWALQRYPGLTREEAEEMAAMQGF